MKIVADENIVSLTDYFGVDHDWVLKPGRDIKREDVIDADILLVRSITPVNEALLHDTTVRFVGSVTTGADHLDTAWLDQAKVAWYAAEGCNAIAVAEYVIASIAALQLEEALPKTPLKIAIIGVGRIGSLLADKLKVLGCELLLCDPVRAAMDPSFQHTPIEAIHDVDLISLHTPITASGEHATFHLIDKNFLLKQKKSTVLLNASRGAVISFEDLLEYGQSLYWCLDVWEQEPYVDLSVLNFTEIATPHIAGYSVQSKCRGIEMVYHTAREQGFITSDAPISITKPQHVLSFKDEKISWRDVVLRSYDPLLTTQLMKKHLFANPSAEVFDALRKNFQERHEFGFTTLKHASLMPEDVSILSELGYNFQ